MEIEELSDIDSDSDIENPSQFNELFDNHLLESFPEPFNIIGQFIMTTINGAAMSYLIKLKNNKSPTYILDIKAYIKYCKNSIDDSYILELSSKLNLNLDDTNDKQKYNKILDNIEIISINIMCDFLNLHTNLFNKYLLIANNDLNVDTFNADIVKNLIPMIKYNLISNVIS